MDGGGQSIPARLTFAGILLVGFSSTGFAVDLEPGHYRNAPVGLNIAVLGYSFSSGDVVVDASLPVEDITAKVQVAALAYARTLDIAGKSAKFEAIVPLASTRFEGIVAGQARTRAPSGFADARFRLTVNFLGSPALEAPEFAGYHQRTILGGSLQVVAPVGQYDSSRLINLGSNRWSFRPEIGLSRALGHWCFEAAAGTWLYTANDNFFGGSRLTQKSITYATGDVIYSFNRRYWLSLNYGQGRGGETKVDGVSKNDLQIDNRAGVTLSLAAGRSGLVNVSVTNGLTTRLGADFNTVGVSYVQTWRGRRGPEQP